MKSRILLLSILLILVNVHALDFFITNSWSTLTSLVEGNVDWPDGIVATSDNYEENLDFVKACYAYYIGVNISQDDLNAIGGSVIRASISVCGENGYTATYDVTTITQPGKYKLSEIIKSEKGGLLVIPMSKSKLLQLQDYYVTLTLYGPSGSVSKTGSMTVNFISGCSEGAYINSYGSYSTTSKYKESFCYYNEDCLYYRQPATNKVDFCVDVPDNLLSIGGDSVRKYEFVKMCINQCGNNICQYPKENATNCNKDCCDNIYHTGLEGTDDLTCFSSCGADDECNEKEVGYLDPTNSFVCNYQCKASTEPTLIKNITFSGGNMSCTYVSNNYIKCTGTLPYKGSDYYVNIYPDESMYNELSSLPSRLYDLRRIEVDGYGIFAGTSLTYPDFVEELSFTLPASSLGEKTGYVEIWQRNRIKTKVEFDYRVVYPTEPFIYTKSCIYRFVDSADECSGRKFVFNFTVPSKSVENLVEETTATINCSFLGNTKEKTVVLEPNKTKSISFEFDVPYNEELGFKTLECTIYGEGIQTKDVKENIKILGKISNVNVDIPSEVVPSRVYYLKILDAVDDIGNLVKDYMYTWSISQGNRYLLSASSRRVLIPEELNEGDATFILEIFSNFLAKSVFNFNTKVTFPSPISVSIEPTIAYVDLSGGEIKGNVIVENSGDEALNVSLNLIKDNNIDANLSLTRILLLPHSKKEVPILISIKNSSKEYDTYLEVKASSNRITASNKMHIIVTKQKIYQYHIEPEEKYIFYVNLPAKASIKLCNVGTTKDSYVVFHDDSINVYPDELVLGAHECRDINVIVNSSNDVELCIKSAFLFDRPAKCSLLHFIKKDVKAKIYADNINSNATLNSSFVINIGIEAGNYTGNYVIVLNSSLFNITKSIFFEPFERKDISIEFNVSKFGSSLVNITVYPQQFKNERSYSSFWIELYPYIDPKVKENISKISDKLIYVEQNKIDEFEKELERIKLIAYSGNNEKAIEELNNLERKIKLSIAKKKYFDKATSLKIYRSKILTILGILLIGSGVFLYYKLGGV